MGSRAGPLGASAMTTASGPSMVAAPEVISQTSAPSAWTRAISFSLSAASRAAGWPSPPPVTNRWRASTRVAAMSSTSGSAAAMAASAASAAARIRRLSFVARPGPSISSSSSSVATSVAEKVLVMTGTSDGPPKEYMTSGTTRGQRRVRDMHDAGHRHPPPDGLRHRDHVLELAR